MADETARIVAWLRAMQGSTVATWNLNTVADMIERRASDEQAVAACWPHLQTIERTIVEMRSEFADDHPTVDQELAGVAREVQALAAWLRGGE